ncbi:MAG TPA: pyridine nucleotide-disulfide oxidoreductase, partial [Pseudomonas sp.]
MHSPDLLLVGAGHSHLGVLRRWARGQRPPGRLALLTDSAHAWYAGRYKEADCRIELAPLCRAAGVELLQGAVIGLDANARRLTLAGQLPELRQFCTGPLLKGGSPGLRLRALGHLRQRGVIGREHCPVSHIDGQTLYSDAGAVWHGPRLLLASGLACADDGFIQVGSTLQSHSHPRIFASGDCASLPDAPRNAWQATR